MQGVNGDHASRSFFSVGIGLRISALLVASLVCACGERENRPNVILIVADTLRSDHLTCYGYSRNTSPNLDAFASGATLHERAVSTASYSLPAHASLFTGQLPMMHLAQTYINSDGFKFTKGELGHRELDSEFLTLAEAFDDAGYRTGGFAANVVFLHPRTGLTQGFDDYFNVGLKGDALNAEIFPWLDKNQEKPFFLFLNYMDTHKKYNTRKIEGFLEHVSEGQMGESLKELYPLVLSQQSTPPELLQLQTDVYDLSIRNMDRIIGDLFAKLRSLDLFDDTLIVFTSDHGEFLGEHQYLTHWKDVYEPVIRVPLIVKNPGQTEGGRIKDWTSTVRVPELIIDGIKVTKLEEMRAEFDPGVDAKTAIAESRYSLERDYYSARWGHRFRRARIAIYEGDHKYIHATDGKNELFNLLNDPAEAKNLISESPEIASIMQEKLAKLIRRAPRPPVVVNDSAPVVGGNEIKELKDLGYL